MPTYEYKCEGCKEQFERVMSFDEHDREKVVCPKCRSEEVKQVLTPFTSRTSRKS